MPRSKTITAQILETRRSPIPVEIPFHRPGDKGKPRTPVLGVPGAVLIPQDEIDKQSKRQRVLIKDRCEVQLSLRIYPDMTVEGHIFQHFRKLANGWKITLGWSKGGRHRRREPGGLEASGCAHLESDPTLEPNPHYTVKLVRVYYESQGGELLYFEYLDTEKSAEALKGTVCKKYYEHHHNPRVRTVGTSPKQAVIFYGDRYDKSSDYIGDEHGPVKFVDLCPSVRRKHEDDDRWAAQVAVRPGARKVVLPSQEGMQAYGPVPQGDHL